MGAIHERLAGALLVGSPIASETPAATATAAAPSDTVATLVEPVAPGVIVPAAAVRLIEHAERVGGILVRSTGGATTVATSTMTIGTGRGTIVVVVIAIAVRTFPMFWLVLFYLGRTASVTE